MDANLTFILISFTLASNNKKHILISYCSLINPLTVIFEPNIYTPSQFCSFCESLINLELKALIGLCLE